MNKVKFLAILIMSSLFALESMAQTSSKIDYSRWVKNLPDTMRLSMMSIPCAHDAATWSSADTYVMDQCHSEDDLFDKGVRAFDLRYGKDQRFWHGHYTEVLGIDIGGAICGLNNFDDELKKFPSKDALDSEFLILYLSDESEVGNTDEHKKDFCTLVKKIVEKYGTVDKNGAKRFIRFRNDLTVKDVRGKIMLLSQEGCCDSTLVAQNENVHVPIVHSSGAYNQVEADRTYSNFSTDNYTGSTQFQVQDKCEPGSPCNGVEKIPYIKQGFERYWKMIDTYNSKNIFNYAGINGYSFTNGGTTIACDDWLGDDEDDKGANHLTYDFIKGVNRPLGIVSFDFCGVGTRKLLFDAYGGVLLNEIIRHNYIRGLISEIAIAADNVEWRAKDVLRKNNYIVVESDLNKSVGGPSIFLGYKTTLDPKEALSDMIVYRTKTGGDQPKELYYGGRCYTPIKAFSECFGDYYGDTNKGADGYYMLIYTSKSHSEKVGDDQMLSSFDIIYDKTKFGKPDELTVPTGFIDGCNDNKFNNGPADFNDGAGGDYIYLQRNIHKHSTVTAYDKDHHYQICTICAKKFDIQNHVYTCKFLCEGIHTCTCSCGHTKPEICSATSYKNGFAKCPKCFGEAFEPAVMNENGEYEVSNAGQLYWVNIIANKYDSSIKVKLTSDITISGSESWILSISKINNRKWTPIGSKDNPFHGTFDGQGHTISGIKADGKEYQGLFGYTLNATVKNLGVKDSKIKGQKHIGSIAGYAKCTTIENVFSTAVIEIAQKTTRVKGDPIAILDKSDKELTVGGLVGELNESKMSNVFFDGSYINGGIFTSKNIGIVGDKCELKNAYAAMDKLCLGDASSVTSVARDDFKSGKLCLLLNNGEYGKDAMWRQNVDASTPNEDGYEVDATPVLNQNHDMVVPAQYNGKDFINLHVNNDGEDISYYREFFEVSDQHDFSCPVEFAVMSAKQTRDMKGYTMGTVCLPFDIDDTVNGNIKLYKITAIDESDGKEATLSLEEIDRLPAGTPAVFEKLDESIDAISFICNEGCTIYPAMENEKFSSAPKYNTTSLGMMYGTYTCNDIAYNAASNIYGFRTSTNKFTKLQPGDTLTSKPFRGWIQTLSMETIQRSKSNGQNGGIDISDRIGGTDDTDSQGPMYDIYGRQVTNPTKGTIVIRNGKKILYNK